VGRCGITRCCAAVPVAATRRFHDCRGWLPGHDPGALRFTTGLPLAGSGRAYDLIWMKTGLNKARQAIRTAVKSHALMHPTGWITALARADAGGNA
jgi:hypothetical protein